MASPEANGLLQSFRAFRLTSPNFEEDMTGVIAKDGKTIVARTSEGEVRGTITDPDTIDLIYSAGGRNMTVVAVNSWKRTRS